MKNSFQITERIAAFFDLDGTLLPHPSLEKRFLQQLRYRGKISAASYFHWLAEAARLAPLGIAAVKHANKMYLHGLSVSTAATNRDFRFLPAALDRAAWHARQAHAICIVSGTLDPLAQRAAQALESELLRRGIVAGVQVCATCLEEKAGRWTGRIVGDATFGEAKALAAQRIARERGFDLAHCFAYGDSALDRWILAAVGNPAAVNPSAGLARVAKRRGWPILQWKKRRAHAASSQSCVAKRRDCIKEKTGNRT